MKRLTNLSSLLLPPSFHGGGSSYHAEEHMVNAAKKAGATKTILRANVDKNGKVTLHGTMHKNSINPIVEVNY